MRRQKMNCDSGSCWRAVELDAAIIQKEEYLMWGTITTNLREIADEIVDFFKEEYAILGKNSFWVGGSRTIH